MFNRVLDSQFVHVGALVPELSDQALVVYASQKALAKAQQHVMEIIWPQVKAAFLKGSISKKEYRFLEALERVDRIKSRIAAHQHRVERARSEGSRAKHQAALDKAVAGLSAAQPLVAKRLSLLSDAVGRLQQVGGKSVRAGAPPYIWAIPDADSVDLIEMSKQELRLYALHCLVAPKHHGLIAYQIAVALIKGSPDDALLDRAFVEGFEPSLKVVLDEDGEPMLDKKGKACFEIAEPYGDSLLGSREDAPKRAFHRVMKYEMKMGVSAMSDRELREVGEGEMAAWQMIQGSEDSSFARCSLEGYAKRIMIDASLRISGGGLSDIQQRLIDGPSRYAVKKSPLSLLCKQRAGSRSMPSRDEFPDDASYAEAYRLWAGERKFGSIASPEDLVMAAIAALPSDAPVYKIKQVMKSILKQSLRGAAQRKPKVIGIASAEAVRMKEILAKDPLEVALQQAEGPVDSDQQLAEVASRWLKIWQSCPDISGRQLEMLEMRVLHGMGQQQIADALCISQPAVKKGIDRCLPSALRALDECGESFIHDAYKQVLGKDEARKAKHSASERIRRSKQKEHPAV